MMQSFVQYTPTKVVFGKDTQKEAGKLVSELGITKVFLVYGGGSVIRSGLLDEIKKSLDEEHISYEEFGGVKPNPRLSFARKGVEKAIAFGAELILAVGGGSAIDTAKGIAIGAANPGTDIWEFWKNKKELKKALPVGTVLTISAAGSEMSNSAVLTDEETQDKSGIGSDLIRPKFELVEKIFSDELASRGIGTWMHPLGGYFISFEAPEGCAKEIVSKCKEAGVVLTGAGSPFPYKKDPKDSVIRIAPTYPSLAELEQAANVFVVVVRMAAAEKFLAEK